MADDFITVAEWVYFIIYGFYPILNFYRCAVFIVLQRSSASQSLSLSDKMELVQ